MSEVLNIFVRGTPAPQPRPRARAIRANGKWIATIYNPTKDYDGETLSYVRWKQAIIRIVKSQWRGVSLEGGLRVDLDFYFPRPLRLLSRKSSVTSIPHISRPDRDNLEKAVLDAITDAGFWKDDAQVCEGEVTKAYVAAGGEPGVRIVVERLVMPEPELFERETVGKRY